MSLPVCPNCGSAAVTWRGERVPNGYDLCLSCGCLAPVREFHRADEALPDYIALRRARQLSEPGPSQLELDRARYAPKPKPKRRPAHDPNVTQTPKVRQWWND